MSCMSLCGLGVDDDESSGHGRSSGLFRSELRPEMLGDRWTVLAESGGFPIYRHRCARCRPHLAPLVNVARRAVGALGPPADRAEPCRSDAAGSRLRDQQDRSARHRPRGDLVPAVQRTGLGVRSASLQTRAVRDGDQWVINGRRCGLRCAHRPLRHSGRSDEPDLRHQGLTYS